jgi:hypothetical protein
MNWQQKISSLKNPEIKRIRKTIASFQASFRDQEIPLDAPILKDSGFCRRPLARDFLYVVGNRADGKQTAIRCGPFSNELLDATRKQIKISDSL